MNKVSRFSWFHLLILALGVSFATGLFAGCPITVLPGDGSTSGSARCPSTRYRYAHSVYLITQAELAANGLVNGESITGIGWNYNTAPGHTGYTLLIVYLQNTADTTNTKSTTWATAIAGMTRVHGATTNLPDVTGPFDIPFLGGSPFTYTGGGVYVAFDWGLYAGTLSTTAVVNCNSLGLGGGLLGAQSATNTPPADPMATSSFRPETRLAAGFNNDAGVDLLISMGSLPLGVVSNNVFQAQVSNYGKSTKTNLVVTLNITGADSFTDTQVIPSLAPCASTLVSFTGFTPTTAGACTVTASVPAGDDNPANDSKSYPLSVTANINSYKYPGTTASDGVGLAGATGEFLAKFRTDASSQVDSVILEFPATGAGTYKVSIRGDNGTGAPGASLYLDAANRTVSAAGSVTIALPSPVAVGPGIFYVGLQQTNTTNIGLSYDTETPIRTGTFYLTTPIGGVFSDFAPSNAFKLNIGAYVGSCLAPLTVDVTPDGTTHVCPGINIPFTATATGGTGTLSYQWTENGADIPTATANTYTANKAVPGTFTYNCKVTDTYGGCINITDPTSSTGLWGLSVINPALTSAPFGVFFTTNFSQNDGVEPVTYTTLSALPTGVTLAANGTLSGTPTQSGSFPVTVTATDTNGCTGTSVGYVLTVGCPTITVTNPAVTTGTAGTPFSQTFTQSGGQLPVTFSTASALPGLSLSSAGALSGTPTVSGTFPVTVKATDTKGCTGTGTVYNLVISCPTIIVSPSSLANGTAGATYTPVTFNQTSGVGAIGWTETGTLPAGMGFDASTATLSGTPTQTGSFPVTVTATDANSCTGSQSLTLVIACPAIGLAPSNLPGGTVGTSYTQGVTASSGIAPYTYEVTSGALPTGLTLSSGGLLAGSPRVPGTFDFTVTATDANRCAGSRAYTVGVVCPTITVSPASLPSALEGNSYTQTLSAGPLSGAYAFTAPPGSLPPGLALDPTTGTLTGMPTAAGTFPFVVTATHAQSGCSGTRSYSIAVTCPTIAVLPAGLPTPVIGLPYSQQFSVTGTSSACTYVVTAGTLPAGLSLSPSGLLSGTPISTAVAAFTVTATDAGGCTGSRSYSVSPANLFFQDDQGRSRFCLNAKTGDYVWQIMTGPAAGIYAGVANVINGGAKIISKPGATQTLNVTYDALRRRASGYFFTASGAYSGLADSNASNNTGGCS